MIANRTVNKVNDESLAALLGAERTVLVLTRGANVPSGSYLRELERQMADGELEGYGVARIVLDEPGAEQFKRDNPWLAAMHHLPFTLLYRGGRKVDAFATSSADYLLERIEQAYDEGARIAYAA
jgi:hypothetical protein